MATKTAIEESWLNSEEFCSVCKPKVLRLLENLTGIDQKTLSHGSQYTIKTAFYVGKQIMEVKGAELVNEDSARKIALEAIRIIKENKLSPDELQKKELEIKDLKKQNSDLATKYNTDIAEIRDVLGKLVYSPLEKGKMQEKQIAKRLKTVSDADDFTNEKSTKSGEDIFARVKNENKETIGTIIVESKNVTKWGGNEFIGEIKRYMKNEQTSFGIIATTVLPDDATNDKMYAITDDGIWIVRLDYLEIAYRAMRDLVVKIRELETESNTKITDIQKTMTRFKGIVKSREYQDKFSNIAQTVDTLRDMSDKLRNYTKIHCDDLKDVADIILNNINELETLNKKALE